MIAENSEKRDNSVKSIKKALLIVETLDEFGELSALEISKHLGWDKTTVHRIVTTMKDAGYIKQNKETKKYRNSVKFFKIGQKVVNRANFTQIVRPYVKKLSEESKETVNVTVKCEKEIIYVDKIESPSALKIGINIGSGLPMYCTGMGKAILAYTNEEEVEAYASEIQYEKKTTATVGNKEELYADLEKIRQRGYSLDNQEYVDGLVSIGAPIFDYQGEPIGAISISFVEIRFNRAKDERKYADLVRKAAMSISKQLGYIGEF